MKELVSYLNANCASAWSGRVWLDIEGTSYWTTSTSTNKAFYKALVDSCSTYGVRCGVYSSTYQWSSIFGSTSYSYGSSLPLWYAHYDNNPSFSDFTAFGGWTTPHAKQYAGDVTLCSMGVDKNYSPSF
jgi:GH25 family lysozyme M1 (1,4-beta-N-acetylmuramidase)